MTKAKKKTEELEDMNREGIIFYESWVDQLLYMENIEDVRDVLRCVKQRGYHGETPDLTVVSHLAGVTYVGMQGALARDEAKWQQQRENASKAGQASAEQRRKKNDADEGSAAEPDAEDAEECDPAHAGSSEQPEADVNGGEQVSTDVNGGERASTDVNEGQHPLTGVNDRQPTGTGTSTGTGIGAGTGTDDNLSLSPPYPLSRPGSGGTCAREDAGASANAAAHDKVQEGQPKAGGPALKTENAASPDMGAAVSEPAGPERGNNSGAVRAPSPDEVSAAAEDPPGGSRRKPKAAKRVEDILSAEDAERFEAFWEKWPKKRAKKEAAIVWQRIGVDADLHAQILQAVAQSVKTIWKDKEPRFIPLASTWLNGSRWEDELPAVPDAEDMQRFEAFWEKWPKKTGREEALEAWQKLQVDDALHAKIMAAAEQSMEILWKGREAQYLPAAARWLSARRFEDEIPDPKPQGLTPEEQARFERFWEVWPNRIRRQEAEEAFMLAGVTDELIEQVVSAVERSRNTLWADMEPRYMPSPASWIKGRRWEDEIPDAEQLAAIRKHGAEIDLSQFRAFRDDPYEDYNPEDDPVVQLYEEVQREKAEAAAARGEEPPAAQAVPAHPEAPKRPEEIIRREDFIDDVEWMLAVMEYEKKMEAEAAGNAAGAEAVSQPAVKETADGSAVPVAVAQAQAEAAAQPAEHEAAREDAGTEPEAADFGVLYASQPQRDAQPEPADFPAGGQQPQGRKPAEPYSNEPAWLPAVMEKARQNALEAERETMTEVEYPEYTQVPPWDEEENWASIIAAGPPPERDYWEPSAEELGLEDLKEPPEPDPEQFESLLRDMPYWPEAS